MVLHELEKKKLLLILLVVLVMTLTMFSSCAKHKSNHANISTTYKNAIEQTINLNNPNTIENARKVSENVQISGSDWFNGFGKSDNASIVGNNMKLAVDQSSKHSWSSYRFIGLNNYQPKYIELKVTPYSGADWYVAVTNYTKKAWQWYGPYRTSIQQIKLDSNSLYIDKFNTTIVVASYKKTSLVESLKLISEDPAPTRSIEGTVKDIAGLPLEGVTVSTSENPENAVLTDKNGKYKMGDLKDGFYTVKPKKDKYVFLPSEIPVTLNNNYATGIDFSAEATLGFYIGGTVQNKDTEKGIAGASVFLLPSGLRLTTNSTGAYTFKNQPSGKYLVRVVHSGFEFDNTELEIDITDFSKTNIDFFGTQKTILPGTISGTIVDINGTPVQFIRNTLNPTDKQSITDEKGALLFTSCTDGNYVVTPSSNIQTFEPPYRTPIINGDNATGQDFIALPQLPGIGSIEGFVKDDETDLPIPNVTVTLDKIIWKLTTNSDEKGYFRFDKLKPSTYSVYSRIPGYSWNPNSYTVKVNGNQIKDKNFLGTYFPGKYSISGEIVDEFNKPQQGVVVNLYPLIKSATSDANGLYTFNNVPSGSYYLLINEPFYSYTPSARDVTMSNSNVSKQDFKRVLGNGGIYSISGLVTLNDGTPVQNAYVFLSSPNELIYCKTDSSGKYIFKGLMPETYLVEPSYDSYKFSPENQTVTIENKDVSNTNFIGSFKGYSISGWIYKNVDQPLSQVVVVLEPGNQEYLITAGGFYQFSNLSPGNYIVTPNATNYLFSPQNRYISIINQDVDFQDFIGESGNGGKFQISGSFLEKDTFDWIAGQKLTLMPDKFIQYTHLDGSFSFSSLLPGNYQIVYDSFSYDFNPLGINVSILDKSITDLYVEGIPGLGSVSGFVNKKNNEPLLNCVVKMQPGNYVAYTNNKGFYLFNKIKKGKFTVSPSLKGSSFSPTSIEIDVNDSESKSNDFKEN